MVGAVAAAEEERKLIAPFMAEPAESLLDWPRILSLLKRDAIDERELKLDYYTITQYQHPMGCPTPVII